MDFDFTGFTFGDYHSDSEGLNIVRVSDGDRYSENLFPEVKDLTAEVPGMDGEYYFGSTYGTKTFEINFAFDSLTEEQFRKLRRAFGTKNLKQLIFDERPYKKYIAKIESPIELSFVCFDEPKKVPVPFNGINGLTTVLRPDPTGVTERIYKGDGTISLICYYPFAKSVFKAISSEDEGSDWVSSSGLLLESEYIDIVDTYSDGEIKVYNPGDIETGFRLFFPQSYEGKKITITYKYLEGITYGTLIINPVTLKEVRTEDSETLTTYESYTIKYKTTDNITLKHTPKSTPNFISSNSSVQITPVDSSSTKYTISYPEEQGVDEKEDAIVIVSYEYKGKEEGFIVDTNNCLIVGSTRIYKDLSGNATYSTTGTIYNKYVDSGTFFKLQPNLINELSIIEISIEEPEPELESESEPEQMNESDEQGGTASNVQTSDEPNEDEELIQIFYDYLYF